MNTFGRRSFLKGLLGTAAVLGLPVEVINSARNAIESIPNSPITPNNPTCLLRVDDLIVPVGSISLYKPQRFFETFYMPGKKPGQFIASDEIVAPDTNEYEICFTTNKNYFKEYGDRKIEFEVLSKVFNFNIKGHGYFTNLDYMDELIGETKQGFLYHYSINGELYQA